ncbi:Hypothetical protein CpATCC19410_1165 [Corynebacterium pseudotuberculosis]|nr:Hypothetical protein CpATCC19410_1165 [Corynebacterium pseudotuberculosis]
MMTLKQEPSQAVAPRRAEPKSRGEKKLLSPLAGRVLCCFENASQLRGGKTAG